MRKRIPTLDEGERKRRPNLSGVDEGYFTVELSGDSRRFLVAMRPGETPVPIPNTMVKTRAADGTVLETVWESRWLPEY